MRCTQYKYISDKDLSCDDYKRNEEGLRKYHEERRNRHLVDDEPDYMKATWINNLHVFEKDTYVPTIRPGLAGPIVSYWARIDNKRRWFASPIVKPFHEK